MCFLPSFELCLLHWVCAGSSFQTLAQLPRRTYTWNCGLDYAQVVIIRVSRNSICKHPEGDCEFRNYGETKQADGVSVQFEVLYLPHILDNLKKSFFLILKR
jgi:hypothetical protein